MSTHAIQVLLADDDPDDCLLFQDALLELPVPASLSTVNDGEQLMRRIIDDRKSPDLIFLDLNMPRKNGFECLVDLKAHEHGSKIPVIIFSTSFNPEIVRLLHLNGARHYIRKPSEFESLKSLIQKGLRSLSNDDQVAFGDFVLHP
jgi:CheY-like chemotaxis protein